VTTTAALARFVAEHDPKSLPAGVRHAAKRSILNYFGVALGGWSDPAGEDTLKVLRRFSGSPQATIIGSPTRLDMLSASFMNTLNANVLDFDDTHLETIIHPTAPVLSPLLALAETRPISGPALIHAFALGVEITCRLGIAVSPGHYARGSHITATCGIFGAAAAAARLLGLDARRTANALGIAAAQSAGLVEHLPTGAKNIQMGNAARNGLLAAFVAEQGLTAAPAAIEGQRGWAASRSDRLDEAGLLRDLGATWELERNAFKAYPTGIVLAPVIDAALELADAHDLRADDIAGAEVRGSALLLARADRPHVTDDRVAKLSLQHSVAVAIIHRRAGVREFSEPVISEAKVDDLRKRVTAAIDESCPVEAAVLTIRTTGGQVLTRRVDAARGSLERPLTDSEIERKLKDLATIGGRQADVPRLIEAVWSLDRSDDAGRLMALAAPPATGGG